MNGVASLEVLLQSDEQRRARGGFVHKALVWLGIRPDEVVHVAWARQLLSDSLPGITDDELGSLSVLVAELYSRPGIDYLATVVSYCEYRWVGQWEAFSAQDKADLAQAVLRLDPGVKAKVDDWFAARRSPVEVALSGPEQRLFLEGQAFLGDAERVARSAYSRTSDAVFQAPSLLFLRDFFTSVTIGGGLALGTMALPFLIDMVLGLVRNQNFDLKAHFVVEMTIIWLVLGFLLFSVFLFVGVGWLVQHHHGRFERTARLIGFVLPIVWVLLTRGQVLYSNVWPYLDSFLRGTQAVLWVLALFGTWVLSWGACLLGQDPRFTRLVKFALRGGFRSDPVEVASVVESLGKAQDAIDQLAAAGGAGEAVAGLSRRKSVLELTPVLIS